MNVGYALTRRSDAVCWLNRGKRQISWSLRRFLALHAKRKGTTLAVAGTCHLASKACEEVPRWGLERSAIDFNRHCDQQGPASNEADCTARPGAHYTNRLVANRALSRRSLWLNVLATRLDPARRALAQRQPVTAHQHQPHAPSPRLQAGRAPLPPLRHEVSVAPLLPRGARRAQLLRRAPANRLRQRQQRLARRP